MNRVLLAAALLGWVSLARASDPQTLRILTYNIHHGVGMDGVLNLARVARVISDARPDLVALQEVDQGTERAEGVEQLPELATLTALHGIFGRAIAYGGGSYGVAVLSRWPILREENRPLPGLSEREPRTALTVDVTINGVRIAFTTTHLDHGSNAEGRLEQARWLSEALQRDDVALNILAGDLNSRAGSAVMALLNEHWSEVSSLDPAPDGAASRPTLGVDHVLVRRPASWRMLESQTIDERIASDHRPVLVVLEIKPGS